MEDNGRGRAKQPRTRRVGLFIADRSLRNLVRLDLERSGFEITALGVKPRRTKHLDAIVADNDVPGPCPLLVRIVDDEVWRREGTTVFFPATGLEALPDLLRTLLGKPPARP